MITYSEAAKEYTAGLTDVEHGKIDPIIALIEAEIGDAEIGYYHPNILFLMIGGKPVLGLSPRKNYTSLYAGSFAAMQILKAALPELGKLDPGVGCLRFKRYSDLNEAVLRRALHEIGKADHSDGYGFNTK